MKQAYTLILCPLFLLAFYFSGAQTTLYTDSIQQFLRSPVPDTGRLHLFFKLTQLPDCPPDTLLKYETLYYDYAIKHGLQAAVPDALYGIGLAHFKSNNLSAAADFFYRSAKAWEKKGNSPIQLSRAYELLATVYKNTDRPKDALQYYRQAFRLKKPLQNEQLLLSTYNGLGNVFRILNQADSAIFYLKKSLELAQQAKNILYIAQVTNNLGNIYWQQEQYTEANAWYEKALASFEQLESAANISETCFNLGMIAFKQKNYSKAITYFNKSLDALEDSNPSEHLEWIHQHLGAAYAQLGQYEKAYQHFVKYDAIKDSLFSIATQEAIADVREKYETEKKEQALLTEKERTTHLSELNKRSRLLIYLLVFIAILIAFLGFFMVRDSRKKRQIADQLTAIKQKENEQLVREQVLQNNIAMLEGQEAERQRISMELHDRLGGTLASLKFMLQSLYEKDTAVNAHSQKIDLLLHDALKDVRGISQNMSVGILQKYGLAEAIQDLKETAETTGNLQVVLSLQGTNRLAKQKAEEVYYIVRELLTNALKHSQATELYIQSFIEEEVLLLTVEDNGVGFDLQQRAKGIGLTNIEARAHKIHAQVDVESSPGNGASFFFRIPIV